MSQSEARRSERSDRDPVLSPRERSIEQEASIALVRASDAFRRWLIRAIEPWGITLQQFNVLRILRGAEPDGLATLTVGERMVERTPGVTRLLDRLEAEGLIERVRDRVDRRRVVARITSEGLALLERVDEPFARAERQAFGDLDSDEIGGLTGRLECIRNHLGTLEDARNGASKP